MVAAQGQRQTQLALARADAALVSTELLITRQSLVIAAVVRNGGDPFRDLELLTAMEHDLAELNAWRDHLLAELVA